MTTATDHARTVLAAILPDNGELLDRALAHLTPGHFTDRTLANLFVMLERYADLTGGVLTRRAVADNLHRAGADAGKINLYVETYDALAEATATDADFRWSLEQLRELAADRATGSALTEAMRILTQGAETADGSTVRGHAEARTHVLQRFAEIDRELSMQDAPEGDIGSEGDEILADYARGEAARAAGTAPGIMFGLPPLDAKTDGVHPGDLVLLVGYTNEGKSLPLDAPVLTPAGWRPMGELRVGDPVVDPEQNYPSQVAAIFPQGTLPVYRLTFSDGSTAEASADHFWEINYWKPVRQSDGRQRQILVRETWTTERIRERVLSRSRNPVLVPTPGLRALDFPEQGPLPVDPYLLGLLLGDGGLSQGTPYFFNHADDNELVSALTRALPAGVTVRRLRGDGPNGRYALVGTVYQRNPLTVALQDLGLMGRRSWDKYVPEQYKWASAKTRLAVLQGLMDTDGGHERGRAKFSSASRQLRDDVVFLARSLGLHAAVLKDKIPTYRLDGETRQGRVAYRCAIWETPELRVFRLARKIQPLGARRTPRSVVSVEYVRDVECQCIAVTAPSRLYVTNDFVPTHNTHLAVQLAWHAAVMQGKNVVFLTTETVRETVRRRLICRHSCLDSLGIPDGINSRDLKNYTLSAEGKQQLRAVVRDSSTNPGYGRRYIAQVPQRATIGHIESKLIRLQRMFPIDLVILDSLYLLRPDKRRSTDREELSGILKEAKQLTTTFNDGHGVPIVSPWQVSRAARDLAERTGAYHSSALSETAEAANSPDLIISLLAPLDCDDRHARLMMQVMKNRDGERANPFPVAVDYATSRFTTTTGRAGPVAENLDDLFIANDLLRP